MIHTFSMAELGVGLININIARHSKVGHFADHPLGQQDISGGQVSMDDLGVRNVIATRNITFQRSLLVLQDMPFLCLSATQSSEEF